jgi:predicted nuclease of predicted toxin-antitoxin system
MRLFFDQNLSPYLVGRLADVYPNSVHVSEVGLERASDREIWEYARTHGLAIVTKDADFSELAVLKSSPPNVVWIRRGNCTTEDIEGLLRRSYEAVNDLSESESNVIELH